MSVIYGGRKESVRLALCTMHYDSTLSPWVAHLNCLLCRIVQVHK